MTDETKIKYTFYNKDGEVVEMNFTIVEIEGMIGGFMSRIQELLDEMGFGEIDKVYRMLII